MVELQGPFSSLANHQHSLIVTFDSCGATEAAQQASAALELLLLEAIGSPTSHAPIFKINVGVCLLYRSYMSKTNEFYLLKIDHLKAFAERDRRDSAMHIIWAAVMFMRKRKIFTFDWSSMDRESVSSFFWPISVLSRLLERRLRLELPQPAS